MEKTKSFKYKGYKVEYTINKFKIKNKIDLTLKNWKATKKNEVDINEQPETSNVYIKRFNSDKEIVKYLKEQLDLFIKDRERRDTIQEKERKLAEKTGLSKTQIETLRKKYIEKSLKIAKKFNDNLEKNIELLNEWNNKKEIPEQKDFIQKATEKHKGLLKEKAEKDNAINENGDIDLNKMDKIAEKEIKEGKHKKGEKLKKEVVLAKTLKKERKKKDEKKDDDWW